jgi:queuine tRNA-ribosyltransferase
VETVHGGFDTPAFMPVGTRGTVKGVLPHLVGRTGAQILLNNTYHMLLRPGPGVVERMGGVHRFMNWPGPILTDSGGYQAYSLADSNAVDDDGVTFKSIVDGRMIRMTPEDATRVQNQLGADIMMAFDDCPPPLGGDGGGDGGEGAGGAGRDKRLDAVLKRDRLAARDPAAHAARVRVANERTIRWLERCVAAHERRESQSLFGIVQGGVDLEQRTWCAKRVTEVPLPGYAIGGVAVGETSADIARVVRHTAPLLPEDRPRYLMGVGYERDLVAAVRAGVDMFDCVLPTRNGRNANAFTRTGQVRLRNAKYAEDGAAIEEGCDCLACAGPSAADWIGVGGGGGSVRGEGGFSRGYLRHLFMAGEMLGPILVTLHNLRHFQRLMADIRATIVTDDWSGLAARWPVAAAGLEV